MSAERHKTGTTGAPTVDISALRARYRDERDRRLRAEGKAQYVDVTGEFGRYLDDPWADPGFARAAVSEATEVLIVGGGFGGLLCGARLREAGIDFDEHRILLDTDTTGEEIAAYSAAGRVPVLMLDGETV